MNGPGDILLQQRLRTMQIIAGALLLGVLVFLGMALFLVHRRLVQPQDNPVMLYMALAFLAVDLPVWYFLPAQISQQQVRKIANGAWAPYPGLPSTAFPTDTHKLLVVSQTTSLIGWALLEGVAFMGCIAYLVAAEPLALCVVGVAVLLLFVTFPTRHRISRWLEKQRARIAEIRQSEGLPSVSRDPVDAEINQLKERITELERKKREGSGESRD